MPRRAFTKFVDTRIVDRDGWLQLVTPSFTRGGLNEVAHCALDLSAAEMDRVIDEAIAQYTERGLRFRWTVAPDSRPADLRERLAVRGLEHTVGVAQVRDTRPLGPPIVPPETPIVVRDVDTGNLDAYADAFAQGWGAQRAPASDAYYRALLDEPATNRLFVAYVGGAPAGAASYVLFPRSAYLLGGVVLPAFRRRGVYRELVAARIDDARARGSRIVTSHSIASTSAPILEHLGFRAVAQLDVYRG